MRALTIRQPWASLIICGEKDVENRTRTTRYRGVLAIHAGHRFDQDLQPWQRSIVAQVDAFPRGAIIGATASRSTISSRRGLRNIPAAGGPGRASARSPRSSDSGALPVQSSQ
jgi:hypothetical protein